MHWTTDKPTREGYYWFWSKEAESELPYTVAWVTDQIYEGGFYALFEGKGEEDDELVSNLVGRWAGPIPLPTEPHSDAREVETLLRKRDATGVEMQKEVVSELFVKWWNDTYPSEAVPQFTVSNETNRQPLIPPPGES